MVVCEYCGSELSSISNLKFHQKNAKKCLLSRGLSSSYKCDHCEKSFHTKQKLNDHSERCFKKKFPIVDQSNDVKLLEKLLKDKEIEIKEIQLLYEKKLLEKDKKIEELNDKKTEDLKGIVNKMDRNQMEMFRIGVCKKGMVNNGTVVNISIPLSQLCNRANILKQIENHLTKEYVVNEDYLEQAIADLFTDIIIRDEDGILQLTYTKTGKTFRYMGNENVIVSDNGTTLVSELEKMGMIEITNEKLRKVWSLCSKEKKKDIGHPNSPPQLKELTWKFIKKVIDRIAEGPKGTVNVKSIKMTGPTSNIDFQLEEKEEKKKKITKIKEEKKAVQNKIKEDKKDKEKKEKEGKKKAEKEEKESTDFRVGIQGILGPEVEKKRYKKIMAQNKRRRERREKDGDEYEDSEKEPSSDEEETLTTSERIKANTEKRKIKMEGKKPEWKIVMFSNGQEEEIEKIVNFNDHKVILTEQIELFKKCCITLERVSEEELEEVKEEDSSSDSSSSDSDEDNKSKKKKPPVSKKNIKKTKPELVPKNPKSFIIAKNKAKHIEIKLIALSLTV